MAMTLGYTKSHASFVIVNAEIAITLDATWQVLGRISIKPGFFTSNPAAFINMSGMVNNSGGCQLRIVEDEGRLEAEEEMRDYDGAEDTVISAPLTVADTGGLFKEFDFSSTVAIIIDTRSEYRLEGRLNGGDSASVKAVCGALHEAV